MKNAELRLFSTRLPNELFGLCVDTAHHRSSPRSLRFYVPFEPDLISVTGVLRRGH